MNEIIAAAIYMFAAHYHSGQWSRGYRLMCMAERAWRRRAGIAPRLDYWERCLNDESHPITRIYRKMEASYANVL